MSQKMSAAVYGVDLCTVSYHITKIFNDAELDQKAVVQKYWITAPDGKKYLVNHYNLQVIIALGFKIDQFKSPATCGRELKLHTSAGGIVGSRRPPRAGVN